MSRKVQVVAWLLVLALNALILPEARGEAIYRTGFDKAGVRGPCMQSDPNVSAAEPNPPDGAQNVAVDSHLIWTPGPRAVAHRISLSTDLDVANDPNSGVSVAEASFDPGPLELGRTYFWRVDEFGGSQWHEGGVWSFTVADVLVIDDFESYTNDAPNRVFVTWLDAWGAIIEEWAFLTGNGTGATVGYDPCVRDIMELDIVHGGLQSMPLHYDNTGSDGRFAYSQTEAILGPRTSWSDGEPLKAPQDWAGHGAKFLSLWFYGDVNNAAEQLYLGLEDDDKHIEIVNYPGGPAAVCIPQWRQWCIDLQEFGAAGVNLADLRRIMIGLGDPCQPVPGGTGLLFLDDIELHARVCPVRWSFASLASGERVEVRYQSQGCFHWLDYRLVFAGGKEPTMTAYRIDLISGSEESLGTLTLGPDDLVGLDKLIEFYRRRPTGGCTTVDTISVSVCLGDWLMAEEQFEDGSCDTYSMDDVTTFGELIGRLKIGD